MTQPELDTYPWDLMGDPADPPVQPDPGEVAYGRRLGQELLAAAREEAPELFGAAPWRLANAVVTLRAEANAANPARDRASDGTIGDAAHATRTSDHNPFVIVAGLGVVRATDLDVDGLDLAAAFERARQLAEGGRLPQVTGGGYLILNRRITRPDWTGWNTYHGTNPHTAHGHVSKSRSTAGFDSRAPWGIFTPAAPPRPPAVPPVPGLPAWTLPRGHWYGHMNGPAASHGGWYAHERPAIQAAQRRLIAAGCVDGIRDWRHGWADGRWEDATSAACRRWFARHRPGQQYTDRLYADDWAVLGR
jgi:hypothetical protein